MQFTQVDYMPHATMPEMSFRIWKEFFSKFFPRLIFHLLLPFTYPLLISDRASSFRLKHGRFVNHDEIYSDFFLFRAQKRGMLREK